MSGSPFARRVAGVFATRLLTFASTVAVAFLLARLLGPDGRGAYSLLLLLPSTLFALAQFGLPSALTYFAGRGHSLPSLLALAAGATIGLSAVLVPLALLAMPLLQESVLRAAPADLLPLALVGLPIMIGSSLFGSILWGRQLVRRYTLILAVQAANSLLLVLLLVGAAGLDVLGALVAHLLAVGVTAVAVIVSAWQASARETGAVPAPDDRAAARRPARLGEVVTYGLRLYPSSVSTFLSYRADLFVLGLLLGDAGEIGLYTLAVSLAEMVFHVPDAIATILYPRVAGSQREEADRFAPSVSRFAVLVTVLGALALIPAAVVAVLIILPEFVGSLLPFGILIFGTVALSVSKVLSGYISGLGRPLPVSLIAVTGMVVNIGLNFALIPPFGIAGAALSSAISYTVHAGLTTWVASRLARAPMRAFLLPGRAEASRLRQRAAELLRRVRG
ncbi:MAG TPA: polysaccharide biosynthesis C-terminal domain-containing protein [candidate division Zixibacteria bacterium]|nr:polysaccharide biosynthesis C-terminal domain-containing protein [candidate division Zixibacteria bacterium]